MNILTGIKNVLEFLNEEWVWVVVIIGLAIKLGKSIADFLSKSKEEQTEIAKEQISQIVLKLVTDAEEKYKDVKKAGTIKRSEVIAEIYSRIPILKKIISQEEMIEYIDNAIDTSLETLNNVISLNETETEETKEGE